MERSIVPGRLSEWAFGSWIYNLKVVFPILHVPHLEPPNQTPFDLSSSVGILLCITGQVIELRQINYNYLFFQGKKVTYQKMYTTIYLFITPITNPLQFSLGSQQCPHWLRIFKQIEFDSTNNKKNGGIDPWVARLVLSVLQKN